MRYFFLLLLVIIFIGGFAGGTLNGSQSIDLNNGATSMGDFLGGFKNNEVVQVVKRFTDNKGHQNEINQDLLQKSTSDHLMTESTKKDFNEQSVEKLLPYLKKHKETLINIAKDLYGVTISEQQIDQILDTLPQNMTVQQLVGMAQSFGIDLKQVFATMDQEQLKQMIEDVYGSQDSQMVFDWYNVKEDNRQNQNKF